MSHAADPRIAGIVAALTTPTASAFIDAPADVDGRALRHAIAAAGWRVVVLDRAPIVDKATLLHACYQSGEYPAGFGFNWDALLDALRDLSWLEPTAGIAVVWRHPDVLESRDPETAATFREVVEEAAGERAAAGYPLLRVVQSRGSGPGSRVSGESRTERRAKRRPRVRSAASSRLSGSRDPRPETRASSGSQTSV